MSTTDPASRHLHATAWWLALEATAVRVCDAMDRAGIQPILLKGPAVVDLLYDDPLDRFAQDVDVLVAPDRLTGAQDVLRRLGFVETVWTPGDRGAHAHPWASIDGVQVDLHGRLFGIGVDPGRAWPELLASTADLTLLGRSVRVLDVPARCLHVALHAAQHGHGSLQPQVDLARALDRLDVRVWEVAADLAHRLGAAPAFEVGLRTQAAGAELADRLGLRADPDTELVLRAESAGYGPVLVDRFLALHGWRARLAYAVQVLAPSDAYLARWRPAGSAGPARRLVRRAWRPLWVMARLPSAVRTRRRARRRVSAQPSG